MEIFFIVVSLVVIIFTINITIDIIIEYNLLKNIGGIEIRIFNITIFKAEISLIAGYFNLIRKVNKKVIQIKIDLSDENFKFLGDVGDYFLKKVFFTRINTNFQIYGTNPFKTAVLSGNIYVFEGIIRSVISAKSPDTTLKNNIDVGYYEDVIKSNIAIGVLTSLFDYVWALLRALVKRSVYDKKYRRKC